MSGIYIHGMEMPTSCDMCWALDDYGDYPRCRITQEQRGYNFPVREQRMGNCPLVPVPPHGRCIDADELKALVYANIALFDSAPGRMGAEQKLVRAWLASMVDDIDDAPTIIQADKEGER